MPKIRFLVESKYKNKIKDKNIILNRFQTKNQNPSKILTTKILRAKTE